MNIADVIELMKHMKRNDISLIDLEADGTRLRMERKNSHPAGSSPAANRDMPQGGQDRHPVSETVPATGGSAPAEPQKEGELVTAPVVGVFYAAPAPDSDPFVAAGSKVEAGTTVCIIEALKLMNEVTCKNGGTVREIYVQDGQRVEYGQPLMRIELETGP